MSRACPNEPVNLGFYQKYFKNIIYASQLFGCFCLFVFGHDFFGCHDNVMALAEKGKFTDLLYFDLFKAMWHPD